MEFNAEPITNLAKPMIAYDNVQKIKSLVKENKKLKKQNSQFASEDLKQRKLAIFYGKD
jgi:hypothetical protein